MKISGVKRIYGELKVPGDKSISHRAVILGSISDGESKIENMLLSDDTLNTIKIFRELGISIDVNSRENRVLIKGGELKAPSKILDCGNSGTTIRLLSGVLSGQKFTSILSGDESLKTRPMDRIIKPISLMGADISANNGKAPIIIKPAKQLKSIKYSLPVASAQVKSAILLASLYTEGITVIEENKTTRDHTERMLKYFGADISNENNLIKIKNPIKLKGKAIVIPGDISSAAYFIVAASIIPGSSLVLRDVGLNPTRTGIIKVLQEMGGDIQITNKLKVNNEDLGDIIVKYKPLKGIEIGEDILGTLIDEIPIITVAATFASGKTTINNARELRYKESDRINTISKELNKMGANIEVINDSMIIHGVKKIYPATLNSHNDHRIAMSLAIAALNTEGRSEILDFQCVDVSYPSFLKDLGKIMDKSFE